MMSVKIEPKNNQNSLRTSEDVYNRIRWDHDGLTISREDIIIGYIDNLYPDSPREMPFNDWQLCNDGGEIPIYKILYFVGKNSRILWDRRARIDGIFNNSGNTVDWCDTSIFLKLCLPSKHWAYLKGLAPKNSITLSPIINLGELILPRMTPLCETALFRWCRDIFSDEPFQPLVIECIGLELVSRKDVGATENEISAICVGHNLDTLKKFLSYSQFSLEIDEVSKIPLVIVEETCAQEILNSMNENFFPFKIELEYIDFCNSSGEPISGFSLWDLVLVPERADFLAEARAKFSLPSRNSSRSSRKKSKAKARTTNALEDTSFERVPTQLNGRTVEEEEDERNKSGGLIVTRGHGAECEVLVIKQKGGKKLHLPKCRLDKEPNKLETAKRAFTEETGLELPEDFKIAESEAFTCHYLDKKGSKTTRFYPAYLTSIDQLKVVSKQKSKTAEFVRLSWLTDNRHRKCSKLFKMFKQYKQHLSLKFAEKEIE